MDLGLVDLDLGGLLDCDLELGLFDLVTLLSSLLSPPRDLDLLLSFLRSSLLDVLLSLDLSLLSHFLLSSSLPFSFFPSSFFPSLFLSLVFPVPCVPFSTDVDAPFTLVTSCSFQHSSPLKQPLGWR